MAPSEKPAGATRIAGRDALEQSLATGAQALHVALDAAARQRLLDYLELLAHWNRRVNLTAVRDPAEMVTRHLLDCLAVASRVRGPRVLDVGSGAGLPGLVLAIACPQLEVTLLDAALKRTRFLLHARERLGLARVEVLRARLEELDPARRFDTVIARASLPLPRLLAAAPGLLAPGGRLLAMLGRAPAEAPAEPPGHRLEVVALRVPGLAAERHLGVLEASA